MAMQPDSNERLRRARRYLKAPAPLHFPVSEPMPEDKAHFVNRALLYDCLRLCFGGTACIGSSQFVYWDASDPRQCAAPDIFVRLGFGDRPFKIWKVWEHGAPQLAVELTSSDDRAPRVWADKLARYHRLGVEELARFDAEDGDQPLRIWDRVEGDFVERSLETPLVAECGPLSLFWIVVEHPSWGRTLRLGRDAGGHDLLPTEAESAEQARLQEQQARLQEQQARREEQQARLRAEAERDELIERIRMLKAKSGR
jgi:hypothetical protein